MLQSRHGVELTHFRTGSARVDIWNIGFHHRIQSWFSVFFNLFCIKSLKTLIKIKKNIFDSSWHQLMGQFAWYMAREANFKQRLLGLIWKDAKLVADMFGSARWARIFLTRLGSTRIRFSFRARSNHLGSYRVRLDEPYGYFIAELQFEESCLDKLNLSRQALEEPAWMLKHTLSLQSST